MAPGNANARLSTRPPSLRNNSPRHKNPDFSKEQKKGTEACRDLEEKISISRLHAISNGLRSRPFNVDIGDNTMIPICFAGKSWELQSNIVYMPSIGLGPAAFEEDDECLYQAVVTQGSLDDDLMEYACPDLFVGRLLYNNLNYAIDPSKCSKLVFRTKMKRSWIQLVQPPAGSASSLDHAKQQLKEFTWNLIRHLECDQTCDIVASPDNGGFPELVILARDQAAPPLKALSGSSHTSKPQEVGWEACVAVIKFCDEKSFLDSPDTKRTIMLEIAKSIRNIFAYQPHRRYVHLVIVTEYSYIYQRWDRAGFVETQLALYRRKGARGKLADIKKAQIYLLDLLQRLVSCDTDLQGFEDSIRYKEDNELWLHPSRTFTSKVPGKGSFILKERLLQSYTLASRGTIGWLAIDDGDGSTWLIIDNWIPHEEFFERRELTMKLRKLLAAPLAGLLSFEAEDIVYINRTGEGDAVYDNRTWDPDVGRNASLVHTRAFWHRHDQEELKPLETAPTAKHILFASRDIVKALHFLYINGRIVHRDIVPWNITWCETSEGPKGYLVDFSCAAMLQGDPEMCEPRISVTPGTKLFMSINALRNQHTQPCDDLESLFYVLMWIFGKHTQLPITRVKVDMASLPPALRQWEDSLGKANFFRRKINFFDLSPDIYKKEVFLRKDFKNFEGFMQDFYEILANYKRDDENVTGDHEGCFRRVLHLFETICRKL